MNVPRPRLIDMRRLAQFLATGATATSLNLFILWLLVAKLDVWYVGASVLAFLLSLSVNFVLQKVWAFAARDCGRPDRHFAQFLAFNLLAMLLNTAIVYTAVEKLRLSPTVGQLAGSAILALMSYLAYSWIFRSREQVSSLGFAATVPYAMSTRLRIARLRSMRHMFGTSLRLRNHREREGTYKP